MAQTYQLLFPPTELSGRLPPDTSSISSTLNACMFSPKFHYRLIVGGAEMPGGVVSPPTDPSGTFPPETSSISLRYNSCIFFLVQDDLSLQENIKGNKFYQWLDGGKAFLMIWQRYPSNYSSSRPRIEASG